MKDSENHQQKKTTARKRTVQKKSARSLQPNRYREGLYGAIAAVFLIFSTVFGSNNWPVLCIIFAALTAVALLAVVAVYVSAKISPRLTWRVYAVIVFATFAGCGVWIYCLQFEDDVLYPSNASTPLIPDGMQKYVDPNSVMLFAGGGVYMVSNTNDVPLISYNNAPLISLRRSPKGALISGQSFGKNGDVVAVLKDNRLIVNKENLFYLKKDKHHLEIWNKQNRMVLSVDYLNAKAMALMAHFFLPGGREIEITKDFMKDGSNKWYGASMAVSLSGFQFSGPPLY